MKRNTLFCFLTIAALGLVMAGPASAGSCTFTWKVNADDGDWRTGANWTASCEEAGHTYPVAGDTAIITDVTSGTDPVIDTNDEAVTTLTINTGGLLTITGKKLTIDGSTQTFNGDLVLSDSTAVVVFTYAQGSGWTNITGSGGIKGEHASAEMQLEDAKIDSDVDIHGMMIVKELSGISTLKNGSTGTIVADAEGVLKLDSGLALEDEALALWSADGDSGFTTQPELQFNEAANLAGNFSLCGDATIRFNAAIDTTGCFDEGIANGWIRGTGNNFFCHDDDNCGGAGANANCFSSDQEFTGSCS
ncbi:MAG: hypothetical protein V3W34_16730 [Phycisphaerae bacterium]